MSISIVAPHPRTCDFADISVQPISKYLRHLRLHEKNASKITEITQKLDQVEKFGCRLEKLVEEVNHFIREEYNLKNYNARMNYLLKELRLVADEYSKIMNDTDGIFKSQDANLKFIKLQLNLMAEELMMKMNERANYDKFWIPDSMKDKFNPWSSRYSKRYYSGRFINRPYRMG